MGTACISLPIWDPTRTCVPGWATPRLRRNGSGVTFVTWSNSNLLSVISNTTFLTNTYAVTTLTRDWPIIINVAAPSV